MRETVSGSISFFVLSHYKYIIVFFCSIKCAIYRPIVAIYGCTMASSGSAVVVAVVLIVAGRGVQPLW